jgi:hypothetical protein
MADKKLTDTVRNASAVNLKYSAELLNLGRSYVRAFSFALTDGQTVKEPDGVKRPPLLLAGKAGETANAAFSISNPGTIKGTVTLAVTGEFADTKVSVEPERLTFDDATDEIVVRVLAKIGRKTATGVDYAGTVLFPEMDYRVTDFVLRKLPS